jgi:hypothetical protein
MAERSNEIESCNISGGNEANGVATDAQGGTATVPPEGVAPVDEGYKVVDCQKK